MHTDTPRRTPEEGRAPPMCPGSPTDILGYANPAQLTASPPPSLTYGVSQMVLSLDHTHRSSEEKQALYTLGAHGTAASSQNDSVSVD